MIFNLTVRRVDFKLLERNVTSLTLSSRQELDRLIQEFDNKIEKETNHEVVELLCEELAQNLIGLLDDEYQEAFVQTPELVAHQPKCVIIDRDHAVRRFLQKSLEHKGWSVSYYPPEESLVA